MEWSEQTAADRPLCREPIFYAMRSTPLTHLLLAYFGSESNYLVLAEGSGEENLVWHLKIYISVDFTVWNT